MTPSDWDKYLEKRTKNIGFRTRLGAFRDPTPAEKAAALAIEIDSWQATKGIKPYTVSAEYSKPMTASTFFDNREEMYRNAAKAYIETPMYAGPRIDVTPYLEKQSLLSLLWFQLKRIFAYYRPTSLAEKIKAINDLQEKK